MQVDIGTYTDELSILRCGMALQQTNKWRTSKARPAKSHPKLNILSKQQTSNVALAKKRLAF
ncbi:unnamed protein product [Ceratitis capitata]|uniref:(Mediterranean fruit fly) hypothetical protein n=1 Tax=Ceratitis capitata TaxID=7213 RepID=A0A811VBF2_CERCA|nr:unnamed protein product [Ceratitis capitata]